VQPFWLWDVGFQLSYAAVLSILLFFRPIYNWLYFPNKLLQWLWKLAAVSLAAQVLTLPISLYYFHQFPLLFLIANLVAVPLSSLILIGCIILCFVSFFPALATVLGSAISYCIHFMNAFVEYLNDLPFATWRSLLITPLQTIFLYITIAALAIWLLEKQIKGLWTGLISLMLFTLLRSLSFIETVQQNKVIVYNIPKHQALDMVQGHQVLFAGDADLVKDDFLYHFHIEPSRILHRLPAIDTIARLTSFRIEDKNILLIDTSLSFQTKENKEHIEVLILSKNPKIYLSELRQALHIKQIVIDGSVPQWKARLWKKDAEDMGIPCHHVVEKGAFVMNF
jgi:competence protein ComEC